VQADHGLDAGALFGVEVVAVGQLVGQRPRAVAGPGAEGDDELVLVYQADLQGEQAEEQVAVGGEGGNGLSLREAGADIGLSAPDAGGCGRGALDRLDYLMTGRPVQPRGSRSDSQRVRRPRGSACAQVRICAQIAHP
jgi:hypothetical protein